MKRNRRVATILALGLLGANILVLSGTAEAARPKCMGKKATKVGTNGDNTINGTKGDDVIVAKGGDDVVFGEGGNDLICGGSGADVLFGGGGNDKLDGGSAEDLLVGQRGNDTLKGGVDPDWVLFYGAPGPVDADIDAGTATGEGNDKLVSGIDGLLGSAFDDTLKGDDATNFLMGNDGNDTLNGFGNIDLITPGLGDDTVDGGSTDGTGFDLDIVYFDESGAAVTVDLQNQTATGEGNDTIIDFEAVYGSDHNDDITGDNGSNILFGGLGDDTIDGGGGSQTIDYASYWFAADAIDANLETGVAMGEGTDTLQSIEGLLGTIDFNDTLTGDNEDNYLDGDGGNNILDGQGGQDLFLGAGGDDTIIGGPGDFDMVDYFCGVCDLNANLLSGDITGDGHDTVSGIEAVGAADGDDTLIGDEVRNRFFGWGGNDVISGMGGDDDLDGGNGTDDLDGGSGTDVCARYEAQFSCETLTTDPLQNHPLYEAVELVRALSRHF